MAAAHAAIACRDLRAELIRAHEYGWVNRLDPSLKAVTGFVTWCHRERSQEMAAREMQLRMDDEPGGAA